MPRGVGREYLELHLSVRKRNVVEECIRGKEIHILNPSLNDVDMDPVPSEVRLGSWQPPELDDGAILGRTQAAGSVWIVVLCLSDQSPGRVQIVAIPSRVAGIRV